MSGFLATRRCFFAGEGFSSWSDRMWVPSLSWADMILMVISSSLAEVSVVLSAESGLYVKLFAPHVEEGTQ